MKIRRFPTLATAILSYFGFLPCQCPSIFLREIAALSPLDRQEFTALFKAVGIIVAI